MTESAGSFIREDLENEEIEGGVEVGDAFGRLEKGDEMAEGELTGFSAEMQCRWRRTVDSVFVHFLAPFFAELLPGYWFLPSHDHLPWLQGKGVYHKAEFGWETVPPGF